MTTLNYIHTLKDKQGYIGAEELQVFLANKPEIYICGGTKFLQSMIEALKIFKLRYGSRTLRNIYSKTKRCSITEKRGLVLI